MKAAAILALPLLLVACEQAADEPSPPVASDANEASPPASSAATDGDASPPPPHVGPAPEQTGETRIVDPAEAERLLGTHGLTLQWIGWDRPGEAVVTRDADGTYRITGTQRDPSRNASVSINGVITEIGTNYFQLDGNVSITNAPDAGRACSRDKEWYFAVTENRRYWRLREFEWCDGLTDYVDVYF